MKKKQATMTQKDLITLMSRRTRITQTDCKRILVAMEDIIVENLLRGQTIKLRRFMHFTTKVTKEREYFIKPTFGKNIPLTIKKGGGNRIPVAKFMPTVTNLIREQKDFYPEDE